MKRTSIVLSFVVLASLALFPTPAYAAAASISMTPSVTSATTNETITVTITEDSGTEPVNAVQANLSYPASSLQYVSTNDSTAFPIDAQTAANNDIIQLARGAYTPVSGSQPVAVLTFKVLGSTGAAAMAFASGTAVVSSTSNTNIASNETGTSLTLGTPADTSGQTSVGNGSDNDPSCATACDTHQHPATTPSTTPANQQPTATLVNTGTDLSGVLGIGCLAAAVSYIAALSYRRLTQR